MRAILKLTATASIIACLAVPFGLSPSAFAQDKAADAPKQVALTQKQIDGFIAASKEIKAIDAKLPKDSGDKPDPKLDSQLEGVAKKNGFANMSELTDATASIGLVMSGVDPETKKYVGADAVIKKQISEVQADKDMSPKDKKQALDELNDASKSASTDKPLPGNVDLVTSNYDKLSQSMQDDSNQ